MTALAEEIDADQSTFRVDVALPEGATTAGALFRIDDEVVRLTGTGRGGTGAGSKRTWAVARGAYGTTRASHANGTTITPYAEVVSTSPFAAPGDSALPDPAEAPDGQSPVTVDGVYGLAAVPPVVLTGTETQQRTIYIGDEDPAVDHLADLIPGDLWIDTSTEAPFQQKVRNEANDGWLIAPMILRDGAGEILAQVVIGYGVVGDIFIQSGGASITLNPDSSIDLTNGGSAAVNITADGSIFLSGLPILGGGSGTVSAPALPTVNPGIADRLWNDAGTVKVSAG